MTRRAIHRFCAAIRTAEFWLILAVVWYVPAANAQPANDSFAERAVIAENAATTLGTLAGATFEPGEPIIGGVSSGQTAWWTWTAPSNGIVMLSVSGTGFAPLLAVYTGADLPTLSLIATNNHLVCYSNALCGCHWQVRGAATFHAARGEAYQIAVDSAVTTDVSWRQIPPLSPAPFVSPRWEAVSTTNVSPGGPVSLQLWLTPAPKNDDFVNRTIIRGSRPHIRASNSGATKEPGEPDHLGNPGGSSVWYSWTAPASGRVTLSVNKIAPYPPPHWGSTDGYEEWAIFGARPSCGDLVDQNPPPVFFPVFAAYSGSSVESLTSANSQPLALADYPHAVSFDAVKGQPYQIAFDGNRGTTGSTPIYLALTKPASNDKFSRRIRLRGTYVVATGYNAGATSQPGEAAVFGNATGKTVWWTWKAPVGGTVSIDLGGSDYTFPVAVFTGSTVSNLVLLTSGSASNSFEAIEGVTYQIAVGDDAGRTGAISLSLRAPTVELPLSGTLSRGNKALLRYSASSGQVILLLRSNDGIEWENVRTALARRDTVSFLVRPPPGPNGPFYRAIVFDRVN